MKFAIEQLFKEIQMDLSKLVSNAFITSLTVIGVSIFVPFQKVYAISVCPDPSTTPITSIYDPNDPNDPNSFFALTKGKGFCRSTPEQYGVTVFKIGFCTENPGNPTGSSISEGSDPVYSSCTWAFESTTGEEATISANGSYNLSGGTVSKADVGTYPYAVIIISKDFKIKGKYGPVAGNTYYTTDTFETSSTNISEWGITTAPLKSFSGPTECSASTEGESVVGETISGYLLDPNGTMLVSDPNTTTCTGHDKLLGVIHMSSDLTISNTTKRYEMTFMITNMGMTVALNDDGTSIVFYLGPFSVTFETN